MGFVLDNKLLIIAGALNGTAGLLLSIIMCKAMNRSFTNVLFGAFGQVHAAARRRQAVQRPVRSATPEEAAAILDASRPASSSFPATAWPWRRRSTKSANCTTC